MLKEQIGETAGRIWALLGERGRATISQLHKLVGVQQHICMQALGWLAREHKVEYFIEKGRNSVALTPAEQETYRHVAGTK